MRISTRGRYAIKLMLDLSMQDPNQCTKVKDIAKRQGISEKYLEQIISVLNKAGYVKSVRGAQGGYMLTKDPSEYTVGMILRLTEGSLNPVSCLDDEVNQCDQCDACETLDIWKEISGAINKVVDGITIADLKKKKKGDMPDNQLEEFKFL